MGDTRLAVHLPTSLDNVPWVNALIHPGSSPVKRTTSLPNLAILESPLTPVGGHIDPSYVAEPAPLGLTDYGLGTTTYSYNTSHIAGTVTLSAPPNVTQPGAEGVINPTAGGAHDGFVGDLNEFGVQLNTVGINVSIPDTSDQGYIWAQNVVNWNDTGLHFVQDTWDFSLYAYGAFEPNDIYSACNNNTTGVNNILEFYGGIVQCVGGTIPISAADFPLSLTLYNNITTNAQNRSQLVYGYSIWEGGLGQHLSGIADTVVFNNTAPSYTHPTRPANRPGNAIDGFTPTPTFGPGEGFAQDAEIDIVGGIGGDNAVFRSINGSVALQYSNKSTGGWHNVPSAYNFGTDTGETSTGIADYWTTSHRLEINQGPAMLYGLWNSERQVAVASGDVHLSGTLRPSYGFVFVSNTKPVNNPFYSSNRRDNLSWLPTDSLGHFNTYLPPLGAPWTTRYYIQAFAAGSSETNRSFTASTTGLLITLKSAPGQLRAPLYAYTNAQASALAKAVGGSSRPPYVFSDLTVDANATFAHLNDYGFPTFGIFQTSGVTNPVYVSQVYEGTDFGTSAQENAYFLDVASNGATGILTPGPAIIYDASNYTAEICIDFGVGDHVTNMLLGSAYGPTGGQLELWGDANAWVNNTYSFSGGRGVFVGKSVDTTILNTVVQSAIGVYDVDTAGTLVRNLTVELGGIGVYSVAGSSKAEYSELTLSNSSYGIVSGLDQGFLPYYNLPGISGLIVSDVNVTFNSLGANLTYSNDILFHNIRVYDPTAEGSQGLDLEATVGTTVDGLTAVNASGIYSWNATDTTVEGMTLENASYYYAASTFDASTDTSLVNLAILNVSIVGGGATAGVYGEYDTGFTITGATTNDTTGWGVQLEYGSGFAGTNLNSSSSGIGYQLSNYNNSAGPITANGIHASDDQIGFNLIEAFPAAVSNATVASTGLGNPYYGGVVVEASDGVSVSRVSASDFSVGVRLNFGSSGDTVSGVYATGSSVGVETDGYSRDNTISDVAAYKSIGVEVIGSSATNVSYVRDWDHSLGVYVNDSSGVRVSHVRDWSHSVGVVLSATSGDTVLDVMDTDRSFGVVIDYSTDIVVSHVLAIRYSVGVYIVSSTDLTINDVNARDHSIGIYYA